MHRDLKPDNVMYDPGSRQVKLLDFGIATDTDISPEQRLTRAGFFVGTLMYALLWGSHHSVTGFEWFLVAFGFLADMASWAGGARRGRDRF